MIILVEMDTTWLFKKKVENGATFDNVEYYYVGYYFRSSAAPLSLISSLEQGQLDLWVMGI